MRMAVRGKRSLVRCPPAPRGRFKYATYEAWWYRVEEASTAIGNLERKVC
jgi:hypothetical protein